MTVNQSLSILFYLKRKKISPRDGKAPIYARITIDGLSDEISLGKKVLPDHWLTINAKKVVSSDDPSHAAINKRIRQVETDLERHFDLVRARQGLATPALVKKSYTTPLSGQKQRDEHDKNMQLSQQLDRLIGLYLHHCKRVKRAKADGRNVSEIQHQLFKREWTDITYQVEKFAKSAYAVFDCQEHQKTFMLTLNEYLLDFLQLAISENRSPNTLHKLIGKKDKYQEFLMQRYKVKDVPLNQLTHTFIQEVFKHFLVNKGVINNTAMKYAQLVKDLMNRAVVRQWIPSNIFITFKCHYDDTDRRWPTPAEMEHLITMTFKTDKLAEIRDFFVFQSFTGYSYAEVKRLKADHSFIGIDGKQWTSIHRQKSGVEETIPLLPIALDIIKKYENHPVCLRRKVLLPIPSCEDYNRLLKLVAELAEININLTTHTGRYYFANEVTYNNGAQLKTISRLLGHKSLNSTAKYVKGNRKHLSDTMADIEEIMFTDEGKLKSPTNTPIPQLRDEERETKKEARIIPLRLS